jgi:predicted acetyltransferase
MEIVPADMKLLKAFENYVDECAERGIDSDIYNYQFIVNNYQGYLKKRIAYSEGKELPRGWPPISTYFCIRDTEILGSIRVRHGVNPYIENVIGHIGYETKPSARGQGVAKFMLSWVQEHVLTENALITCDSTNAASRKVIESCGAKYLNLFYSEEDKIEIIRYQITC